jgi:CheY-like chemotaxis protein
METQSRPERSAQTILIVEEDEALRGILDHSLRHAGFAVGLASTPDEGLRRLAENPDLLIAGATDPGGLELCRRAKQGTDRMPPAVVLIAEPGVENKTRGLEAGADDFVVKPIYVQEVVARARALLQRRERERLELSARGVRGAGEKSGELRALSEPDRFVSDIADVPLVDLVRAVAANNKSGLASITAPAGARGDIFFRQGNVVDAEVGRLSGREAVYRLFCWTSGRLEVEWKSIRRKDTIDMRAQDLLMEALARVDEWQRLLAGLPPLETILEVDYRVLAERLADIPDEVNRILRLFDGVRTLIQVIDDCGLPDLDAAAVVSRLCQERIIQDARTTVSENDIVGSDMAGWISEVAGPFRSPPRPEREVFAPNADPAAGIHNRITAPIDPLERAPDPADDEMRARFTDRLNAEEPPAAPAPSDGPPAPTTLPGLGKEPPEDEPVEAGASPSELVESAPVLAPEPETAPMAVDPSAVSLDESIPPEEEETPVIDPELLALPIEVGPPPPSAESALPTVPENRAASGEIMVPAARAATKHSPAAEERLAHLREESARSFVRPSQTLTPPGSARALDEPPPLLDSPPPEPPRNTTELLRATAVERVVEAQRLSGRGVPAPAAGASRHLGLIVGGLAALVVVVAGVALLGSRHGKSNETEPPPAVVAAAPAEPATAPVPATAPAARAELDVQRAAAPARDGVDERVADPKLARAWAAEAPALLAACRSSYLEARMKDAEAACTAARDANPDSAEANGYLAHVLFSRNRRPEALAAAERAVKLDSKLADAYLVIGGIHHDAGEMSEAKHAYQRYLELAPHAQKAGDVQAIVDRLGKP